MTVPNQEGHSMQEDDWTMAPWGVATGDYWADPSGRQSSSEIPVQREAAAQTDVPATASFLAARPEAERQLEAAAEPIQQPDSGRRVLRAHVETELSPEVAVVTQQPAELAAAPVRPAPTDPVRAE
jgi:hypothetical protein